MIGTLICRRYRRVPGNGHKKWYKFMRGYRRHIGWDWSDAKARGRPAMLQRAIFQNIESKDGQWLGFWLKGRKDWRI